MNEDEWRVEVELDDEEHGYGLGERLRSHDLDDEARKRLGGKVFVSRDGSRLFLYATTESAAREAERVVRELLTADRLTAQIAVTRWHPVEEAWEDASVPLPATADEVEAERRALEEDAQREADEEGSFDWFVRIHAPSRSEAAGLATRLEREGHSVSRLWRYVEVGVLTEERASELAQRLREELPPGTEVSLDPKADLPSPAFVLFESRLPGS